MKWKMQLGLLGIVVTGSLLWISFGTAQVPAGKAPAKSTTESPSAQQSPAPIRNDNAAATVIYDKDGKIHLIAPDGKAVEQCQLCTPELEARFGKNCLQAARAENAKQLAALTPKLCRGAGSPQTSLKGLSSISGVRHSGSECYIWYVCQGGSCQVYQYCW